MPPDLKPEKRIKDPDAIKRFRMNRIGELCERCAMRPGISAHHAKFRGRGGDDAESNLVWLCGTCHDFMHGIHSTWY